VTAADTGQGLAGISVDIYTGTTSGSIVGVRTDASGYYTMVVYDTGNFLMRFSNACCDPPAYQEQWYSGRSSRELADPIALGPGATVTANAVLTHLATFVGRVLAPDTGMGVPNWRVAVYLPTTDNFLYNGYTDASGHYTVTGVAGGTYQLFASPANMYDYIGAPQWYDGQDQQAGAQLVSISLATTRTVDITLFKYGGISGRVTAADTGAPISGAFVRLYTSSSSSGSYVPAFTDGIGQYGIPYLSGGTYFLEFLGNQYQERWFNGKPDQASADPVVVAHGITTTVDSQLLPLSPGNGNPSPSAPRVYLPAGFSGYQAGW
jgi:hypothetical protein